MKDKIKVLILEDLPSDAELAEREVKAVLKNYTAVVTDTEQGFIKALENFKPDLIISDYMLPAFNGMKALQITRKKKQFIPFIILTGSMNEETAVECIKAGADDYVIKEHIKRLGIAILNALDKKKKRQERKQAEEALREAKNSYQTIFNLTGDIIVQVDTEGRWLFLNDNACSFWGGTREELQLQSFADYLHPDDQEKTTSIIMKMIETGEAVRNLINHQKTPEGWRVVQWNGSPMFDKGEYVGFQATGRDITQRKQAEEALKDSEEKFRDMANLLPQVVFEMDFKGNLTFINQQAFDFFGYSSDDFEKGFNVMQVFLPEDRDKAKKNIQNIINGNDVGFNEYFAQRKDGSTFPVLIYSSLILKDKKPAGLRGIMVDITERKQAEEALRESEERFRYLLATSPSVIYSLRFQGDAIGIAFVSENIKSILGYKPEDVYDFQFWQTLIHPDDLPSLMAQIPIMLEIKEGFTLEYRIKHKDGTYRWLRDTNKPIFDDKDELVEIIGSWIDITERKQAEEALLNSEAQKNAILNGITTNIALVDKELEILWANKAAVSSINKQSGDIVGHPCYFFWGDKVAPCANCPTLKAFQTGKSEHIIVETPDGRIWDESGEPILDANGNVAYVVEIAQDITERKQA
ncbi:MAG: PAS domain S-box protein, partial [Anaerolineaceae bacterium]|nr:PAS domain S-box protein [Anaerolineaceae bacterium]